MRKAIRAAAIIVASLFALSALAQSNQAQDQGEHHSKFSKLAVWRHHKDSKDTKKKSISGAKASPAAAQPQVTATAMKPRPVKHISDMDDDTTTKPVAKPAAPAHSAKAPRMKMASSKAPAGKDSVKPSMHHAAQKSPAPAAAKAKAAHKKSAKPAASKDKKPA